MPGVGPAVDDYLTAMAKHDYDLLATAVSHDVVRTGPYGDSYSGRADYVTFISTLLPTLPGHTLDVARVTYADDGRRAFAEITETVLVDGQPLVTREVLVLDLNQDGLINRIDIFIKVKPR